MRLFDRSAKFAFIIACLTLIGSGVAFQMATARLNIYLRKEPVQLREHFSSIHRHLDRWQAISSDIQHDSALIESLGTDIYLDRYYARDGNTKGDVIALHMAYYTGVIDALPHVPDRCMVAHGYYAASLPGYVTLPLDTSNWRTDEQHINERSGQPYPYVEHRDPVRGTAMTVRLPIAESEGFRLRVTEFRHREYDSARIFAGFFYIANGHLTASPYNVRSLAFDQTDKYSYYCKVQFTQIGPETLTVEGFAENVADLLAPLLPEIMRCLPDWAEIEARERSQRNRAVGYRPSAVSPPRLRAFAAPCLCCACPPWREISSRPTLIWDPYNHLARNRST